MRKSLYLLHYIHISTCLKFSKLILYMQGLFANIKDSKTSKLLLDPKSQILELLLKFKLGGWILCFRPYLLKQVLYPDISFWVRTPSPAWFTTVLFYLGLWKPLSNICITVGYIVSHVFYFYFFICKRILSHSFDAIFKH